MTYYDQIFDKDETLPDYWLEQEFEQCTFRKLDLTGTALTGSNFVACRFDHCNLTRVDLKKTKLYDIRFINSQLLHVSFEHCNPFGFHADFDECRLDYAVFLNRKLKKAHFINCSMREMHFINCELTGTVFQNCNLELTTFADNNLTQTDFSTSYNLIIDPDINRLKKARLSLHNLPGLLRKHDLIISQ